MQILTARHCVDDDVEEIVNGEESAITIKKNALFVLLGVHEPEEGAFLPVLNLRKDIPRVGEMLTAYGYGYGIMFTLQRTVAAVEPEATHVFWNATKPMGTDVYLDGPLAPGMSGGPVLDQRGQVVGLIQATSPAIGATCGTDEMRAFLK